MNVSTHLQPLFQSSPEKSIMFAGVARGDDTRERFIYLFMREDLKCYSALTNE